MADYKRGDVRKEGLDMAGAIGDYRDARRAAETLVEREPDDAALRLKWVATKKLGDAQVAAGDHEAVESLKEAAAIARALFEAKPTDPARRRDLALSLASQGEAALAARDANAALGFFTDYLDDMRKLAGEFPSDPTYTRGMALAFRAVARGKFAARDNLGAARDLDKAVEIAEREANADPLNARASHDLLAVLMTRAQIRLGSDKAAARADLDQANRIARDFVGLDSRAAMARFDLAKVLMQIALNFNGADELAREARQLMATLSDEGVLTPADKATFAQFEQLIGDRTDDRKALRP
jgi:tetratricopeptide (TPR) repeat protein